jgi:hypothetical protein
MCVSWPAKCWYRCRHKPGKCSWALLANCLHFLQQSADDKSRSSGRACPIFMRLTIRLSVWKPDNLILRGLRFSQRRCWRFRSSGMLRRVFGQKVSYTSNDPTAFIWRFRQTVKMIALLSFEMFATTSIYPTTRRNIPKDMNVLSIFVVSLGPTMKIKRYYFGLVVYLFHWRQFQMASNHLTLYNPHYTHGLIWIVNK